MKRMAKIPLAALALVAIIIAGCQTTRQTDWNNRIGRYTFDQAVNDLGPPDFQDTNSAGQPVAEWINNHRGGSRLAVGTGYYAGNGGFGGLGVGAGPDFQLLTLTFGSNDVLVAWVKNY